MERLTLGKRINTVRKNRRITAEKLSEQCHINATYLRQIEGGMKIPSLPVFIDLCNALEISPDYLLQDVLASNEVTTIRELQALWKQAPPSHQKIAGVMLQSLLEYENTSEPVCQV